ncbi:uncharacterized protein LOC141895233 [Acropora palmata]|uniref:uncharacterized protein LOC141895233 n=1 Tax=Acropora palmata TaxID=6131 RepID=UPI003DA17A54
MTRPLYVAISFLAGVALLVVRGEEERQTAYLTRAGEDIGQTFEEDSTELYQNGPVREVNDRRHFGLATLFQQPPCWFRIPPRWSRIPPRWRRIPPRWRRKSKQGCLIPTRLRRILARKKTPTKLPTTSASSPRT